MVACRTYLANWGYLAHQVVNVMCKIFTFCSKNSDLHHAHVMKDTMQALPTYLHLKWWRLAGNEATFPSCLWDKTLGVA